MFSFSLLSAHTRDSMFEKIKAEESPNTSGFCVLCPSRWTVRSVTLASVTENLQDLRTYKRQK